MSSPIKDPEVPFVGLIDGGFEDGRIVRIQGYTAPVANRFNINLQCDGSDDADIAVHISVRLQEGYVARNSFQDGEWGEEKDDGELKIGTGEKFEVLILNSSTGYKIAMNGQHFCEFPHRIAASKVTHLKIDGDVSISLISYEGGDLAKSSSSQQNTQFGQQPNYGGYGPPQGGYGGYGPGPQGYGPPPPGYQGYGQQGGYGAPPPPGYQQDHEAGGFGDFLGSASEVIAGAIKSGMAEKLLGQLTGGGNQPHDQHQNPQQQPQYHPQQQPQQQPQQPSFNLPQMGGGGSIGGLGSMGSLLSGFAEQILNPKRDGPGGHGGHH